MYVLKSIFCVENDMRILLSRWFVIENDLHEFNRFA